MIESSRKQPLFCVCVCRVCCMFVCLYFLVSRKKMRNVIHLCHFYDEIKCCITAYTNIIQKYDKKIWPDRFHLPAFVMSETPTNEFVFNTVGFFSISMSLAPTCTFTRALHAQWNKEAEYWEWGRKKKRRKREKKKRSKKREDTSEKRTIESKP